MKSLSVSFALLSIVYLSSCMNNPGSSFPEETETATVVAFAVRTALSSNRPDFDSLRKQYRAGDTLSLTTDSLSLSDLPDRVDSIPIKVIGHSQLCAGDTIPGPSADYLYIRAFAKNDTGYYVSVQSLNCQRASNGEALGVFITKRKTKGQR